MTTNRKPLVATTREKCPSQPWKVRLPSDSQSQPEGPSGRLTRGLGPGHVKEVTFAEGEPDAAEARWPVLVVMVNEEVSISGASDARGVGGRGAC